MAKKIVKLNVPKPNIKLKDPSITVNLPTTPDIKADIKYTAPRIADPSVDIEITYGELLSEFDRSTILAHEVISYVESVSGQLARTILEFYTSSEAFLGFSINKGINELISYEEDTVLMVEFNRMILEFFTVEEEFNKAVTKGVEEEVTYIDNGIQKDAIKNIIETVTYLEHLNRSTDTNRIIAESMNPFVESLILRIDNDLNFNEQIKYAEIGMISLQSYALEDYFAEDYSADRLETFSGERNGRYR